MSRERLNHNVHQPDQMNQMNQLDRVEPNQKPGQPSAPPLYIADIMRDYFNGIITYGTYAAYERQLTKRFSDAVEASKPEIPNAVNPKG